MREILFRAKRLDNGEWVEGDGIHYPKSYNWKGTCWIDGMRERANDWVQVDPKTVCQYTGRTDKNGKKVFEGDIVKDNLLNVKLLSDSRKKPRSGISVVRFGEHEVPSDDPFEWGFAYGFYFEGETLYPTPAAYDCPMHEDILTFEVIGNIFDNPELLKGGGGDE